MDQIAKGIKENKNKMYRRGSGLQKDLVLIKITAKK